MDHQMEELLPIVSELAQKYAGYESTSITYEKAQSLMENDVDMLEYLCYEANNIAIQIYTANQHGQFKKSFCVVIILHIYKIYS